jgi:hypothetical protein
MNCWLATPRLFMFLVGTVAMTCPSVPQLWCNIATAVVASIDRRTGLPCPTVSVECPARNPCGHHQARFRRAGGFA